MEVNNKVYLHELDCSMETETEIQRGQWALYDQIVNKGNIVVLSYFEVIDSCSFYSLYNSTEKNKQAVLSLFKSGRIKLNGYKDRRTPAQCVVEQIDLYIDKKRFPYLFSVLDNDILAKSVVYCQEGSKEKKKYKNVLIPLKRAILYSDPQLVRHLHFNFKKKGKEYIVYDNDAADNDFLDFLEKYIRMVLEISAIENVVDYKGKMKYMSLMDIYARLENYVRKRKNLMFTDGISWNDILDKLNELKKEIDMKERNNREQWYIQIDKACKEGRNSINTYVYLAKDVIDAIYNMTVESSVRDVYKNYKKTNEGIFNEVNKHVSMYWKDYKNNNQHWHVDKKKELDDEDRKKKYLVNLDWGYAAFLFENEKFLPKEDENWKKTKRNHSIRALVKSIVLIVSYYFISLLSDLIMELPLKVLQLFANIIQKALAPIISIAISEPIAKLLDKANMTGADSLKYSLPDFRQKIKFVYLSLSDKNKNEMEYSK